MANKNPKTLFEAVAAGQGETFVPRKKPKRGTDHSKGTVGRIEEYARRLMNGEELFSTCDSPLAATLEEQRETADFVTKRYRARKRVW
jgi:uncharacterized FAD-dependent dehydrogenase